MRLGLAWSGSGAGITGLLWVRIKKLASDRDLWPGSGVRALSVSPVRSHLTYTRVRPSPTPHAEETELWPRLGVAVGGWAWACSPSPLPSLLVNPETTKVAQTAFQ